MSYQVLALKYRPRTFDEVIGQNHVTDTLANAISSDRVAHAILFTGPRGTGKTTIARILARAMNCKQGPVPEPCNSCKICKDIIEGHCTDVFEIDGASNNSVDQIRDLRQNVTYMPSSAKYKIYIIDEVHMLSTAAFNALLKTLEEPPEHVMFIFATTEAHKIPATILSRCQRHDLNRIQLTLISNHLQKLCSNEGYTIEKESLDLISQEADGSIRDGLSLLDRILSSADTKEIEPERVLAGLGIQDQQVMHDISAAIFNQNGAQLIDIIEKINNSGIDLKKFYSDIIYHFRNYNVIKICGKDTPAANITDLEKTRIIQASDKLSSGFINTILQILLDGESIVNYSSHTKIAIEMVLLKLLHINPGAQIDKIIDKLDTLVKHIDSNFSQTSSQFEPVQKLDKDDNSGNNYQAVREPVPTHQFQNASDHAAIEKNDQEEKTWPAFLKKIEQKFPVMFALLSKGIIKESSDNEITVEVKTSSSFENKRIENKKHELQTMCKKFLGKYLTIKIVSQKTKLTQSSNKEKKNRAAAFNHPMVVEAKQMFNGEIINY
ncbi:MAG: DNA polymerase III subunit gamma/tau [Deltaproteobacteria bacterium]|nr:MAG: DNA polymerase III subunit gamma/tau [Deltaproteobacteria bacterium]